MTNDSAPPPPSPSAPGAGSATTAVVTTGTRIIGTYEIEKLINSGGMGEVYRGVNIHNGEPVAIKIVLASLAHDPKIVALFQKEATVLGRLAHEAIVRYHVFTNDPMIGRPCMVMEFVEGTAMSDRVEQGPMPVEDVRVLFRRVASGLDKAHRAGVVHRDLSPDNVILEGGAVEHAKLIDFGIAKSSSIGGGTLLQGQFAGKFNWVSPEQLGAFGGVVDGRSDIYSLALLIAAASRGKVVDMGASIVDAVGRRAAVPDLTGVNPSLMPLLSWMLQPDPGQRPDSMASVMAALDNAALIPAALVAPGGVDANRTVIGGSLPPFPLPGQPSQPPAAPQSTGGPSGAWGASTPPGQPGGGPTLIATPQGTTPPAGFYSPSVPPQPAPTSPPAQVTGGFGIAPAGAEDVSPFGAPVATTPPLTPAAAVPAMPAKGGKGGLIAGLVALIVAGGGAGAYFGGLIGPSDDKPASSETQGGEAVASDAATPASDATSAQGEGSPEAPAAATGTDSGDTASTDAGSAAGTETGGATGQPAESPVQAGADGSDTDGTDTAAASDAPADPAPQADPQPAAVEKPAAQAQLDWLAAYKSPACTLLQPGRIAGDAVAFDGFATTTTPLEEISTAMERATGHKPDVALRLINDTQCPVLDFAQRQADPSVEPVRVMLRGTGASVKSGATVQGQVEGAAGRSVALFLVSEAGGATNLKQWVATSSDGTASFSFTVSLAPGAPPAPQLILALATDRPLAKLDAVPNGVTVKSLMPFVDVELSSESLKAATGLGHFLLQN